MGYMVELNTLIGLPKDFDVTSLAVGKKYKILKPRERSFPLHIAMLIIDAEWNFYGYGIAHSAKSFDQQTELEFEVLSIFSADEQIIYKNNFLNAAKITGEVK